jgi:hypothetical protein
MPAFTKTKQQNSNNRIGRLEAIDPQFPHLNGAHQS